MEEDVRKRILLFLEEEKNTTVSAFARRRKVNQSKMSKQIKFSTAISLNTILLLLDEYKDLSAEWLLRGEGCVYIKSAQAEVGSGTSKNITNQLVNLLMEQLEDLRQEKNRLLDIIYETTKDHTAKCHNKLTTAESNGESNNTTIPPSANDRMDNEESAKVNISQSNIKELTVR